MAVIKNYRRLCAQERKQVLALIETMAGKQNK
jgi:hypothetical protein